MPLKELRLQVCFIGSFRNSEIERGNDYSVEVWIDDNWGSPDYRDDLFFPWLQNPELIKVQDIDGTNFTVRWKPNDDYAETFQFWVRQSSGGWSWYKKYPIDGDDEITDSVMYTTLNVNRFNTKYQVRVETFDAEDHDSGWSNVLSFTTGMLKEWYWNSNENTAFKFRGKTDVLTANRWISFCEHVTSVAMAVQDGGYGQTQDYWVMEADLIGVESGEKMEAKYFNKVFKLLNHICTLMDVVYDYPGDTAFESGKIIYGKYFTEAETALNQVIYKLNHPPEE